MSQIITLAKFPSNQKHDPNAEKKHCKECDDEKKLEDFPKNRCMVDGRGPTCKACKKKQDAERKMGKREWAINFI